MALNKINIYRCNDILSATTTTSLTLLHFKESHNLPINVNINEDIKGVYI